MNNENKNATSKEGNKKSMALIGKLADMVKGVSELSKTVVEQADSEKYANSVNSLNQGVSDTYEQMRQLIVNSDTMSDVEKIERLQLIADQEREAKRQCGQEIKENRENVGKIALEVTKGVLTGGLSFAPGIVKEVKQMRHNNETVELPASSMPVIDSMCDVVDVE